MIEIIAMTPEDAEIIEACGANRIELVSSPEHGGLTPDRNMIGRVVKSVSIPVNVMIRPHNRSFIYSSEEIRTMREDIIASRELGANGVVFGVLDESGNICRNALEELLEVCEGLDVTFHRAIDESNNPVEGISILSHYPKITTVLTSGGRGNILDNLPVISQMVNCSGHIKVMAGGGLNFGNIEQIVKKSGAREYHFGSAVRKEKSYSRSIDENNLKRLVKMVKECSE